MKVVSDKTRQGRDTAAQIAQDGVKSTPPLLPLLALTPAQTRFPSHACRVALPSPDLLWWVVSPFNCPLPEQHVPDSLQT
mgnify:CR=1 FL=1